MKMYAATLMAIALFAGNAQAGQVLPNNSPGGIDKGDKLCSYVANLSGTVMKYRQMQVSIQENRDTLGQAIQETFVRDGDQYTRYFLEIGNKLIDDAYNVPLVAEKDSPIVQQRFIAETYNLCMKDIRNGL